MKKVLKISVLVIILGVFGWTIFYLYKKSQKKPVMYETQTAFVSNVIKKTVATGSVVPRKEIEIKPQVSGIIDKVYVIAGEKVSKGDVIAKVKIIPNMVSLNEAESRLKKAKLSFDDNKLIYERQKKVFEQGVIPEAEFQEVRIAYLKAEEELDAAENHLQLIKEGVLREGASNSNTLIRSTIDGMVLDVPVEIGNSVIESNTFNDGTTIATVADMGEMIFEGKVDETEVGKIKPGMKLLLSVGAIEEEQFDAILEYIAPKGIEDNGAIQFEIKADVILKPYFFIRAGYSANADIVLERRDSVMVIEESLVKWEEDSAYVEVEEEPQQFEKRYISLGLSDGINVEILDGITMEDKIKGKEKKDEQKDVET
jgi:HlyD family secretion protein